MERRSEGSEPPRQMNHRVIRILIGVVIIAAVVGGVVYWEWPGVPRLTVAPPPAEAVPTMNWAPTSVTQIIAPGESKTISVSFVASEAVSDVVVSVVPELQPFVQVSPSAFGGIVQGQTLNVSITVSAASSSPLGTFAGTVQLRSRVDPKKIFAKPLPVTVEVWQRITEPGSGVSLVAPQDWIIEIHENAALLLSPSTASRRSDPEDIHVPPDIHVEVLLNTENRDVVNFARLFNDGWFSSYRNQQESATSSRPVVVFSDLDADVGHAPVLAAFIEVSSSRVVLVTVPVYSAELRSDITRVFETVVSFVAQP